MVDMIWFISFPTYMNSILPYMQYSKQPGFFFFAHLNMAARPAPSYRIATKNAQKIYARQMDHFAR